MFLRGSRLGPPNRRGVTFIFAAALTLFLNVFAARAHADDDAFAQGLLWRIERPGAAPSYLLGTIHLPDPRVSRPTPNTLRALGRCKTLFTEVEFEPQAIAAALSLPPGLPLRNEILVATFGVVAFSIVAQGLTMPLLLRRLGFLPYADQAAINAER